jgi:stage V sporulation protein AE
MDILLQFLKVFVFGGLLCVIAQILIDKTKLTPARILVGYVVVGVILTGIGIYQYAVDFAGCGATVPLTGFGYALAKGVEEAIANYGAIGILTGGLSATAAGISVAICAGFIVALFCKGKMK